VRSLMGFPTAIDDDDDGDDGNDDDEASTAPGGSCVLHASHTRCVPKKPSDVRLARVFEQPPQTIRPHAVYMCYQSQISIHY
jgi:hypothetical protein